MNGKSPNGERLSKSEATKLRIREAAYALADEFSWGAITVDQISTHAGVSLRTFYRHFSVKEALLFNQEEFTEFIDAFEIVLYRAHSPIKALVAVLNEDARYFFDIDNSDLAKRRRRLRYRVRGDERVEEYYAAFLGRTQTKLMAVIDRWAEDNPGQAEGSPYLSAILAGIWHSLAVHHITSGEDHHFSARTKDLVADLRLFAQHLGEYQGNGDDSASD